MNSLTVKRILMTFAGIFLAGVSVAIFKASDFGTDAAGSILSGQTFYRTWNCAEPVFYGNYRGKRNAAF